MDITCCIRPHLALLDIELKGLTVVLNSIHNPSRDRDKRLYFFRQNPATLSPEAARGSPGAQAEGTGTWQGRHEELGRPVAQVAVEPGTRGHLELLIGRWLRGGASASAILYGHTTEARADGTQLLPQQRAEARPACRARSATEERHPPHLGLSHIFLRFLVIGFNDEGQFKVHSGMSLRRRRRWKFSCYSSTIKEVYFARVSLASQWTTHLPLME